MKQTASEVSVSYRLAPEVKITHHLGTGTVETATHHDVGENGYRKVTTLVFTSPWYKNGKEAK